MRKLFLFLLSLPLFAVDVTLTITETGSQARTNWATAGGVPLTEADNVLDAANLMVTQSDGTTKIASQMRVLACWGNAAPASATTCPGGSPIKVVLLDYQVPSISSGGTYTIRLKDRSGADPSPPTLSVTDGASTITIDTGAAEFVLSKTAFDVFNSVNVTGAGDIITAGSGQKLYVTEGGTEYNTLNADAPTMTVLKSGPLRAEILVEGQMESSGGAAQALRYFAWMYFYAGSARATINLRIIFDKDMWSFNPTDLAIKLPLGLGANFTFQTQGGTSAMTTTDYAYLLQQDHGVTGTGWYHRKNAVDVASGGQSDGACGVYDSTFGVVAWKRWAWQEYPWECEVTTGKTLRLGLWPAHSDYATLVPTKKTEAQGSSTINHIFPYRDNESMDLRGVNESGASWPDSEHNGIGMGKMWQIELEFHGGTALDSEDRADAYAAPLMALNSTYFTGTGIFGPIGPCISGLGAGNLLQDAEDTLAASFTYYRTTTQNRRNYGLFVYGDSQYDNAATTSRWWLMQRVDWNTAHAMQYLRCGDRTTFDEAEAINRHIGEQEIVHIDVAPFTDADGHHVNKAKGGVVATHDVGNSHWNNCTWGKPAPCTPVNSEPFVDDTALGFRMLYFLTGHEFYRDNNKRRADALVAAGPPTPTGPRSISNMATPLFQYELTGTASYLTAANVIANEIKLNSSSGGFEVSGAGYLSAGETQLGWSIFHANWAGRAMWLYHHLLDDADMMDIIRKTGKAMAGATHENEAHGAEQWFASAFWYLGTWYQSDSGGADAVKILRREIWELVGDKRQWVSNGSTQWVQNYVPAMYGLPVAIYALQDYGSYSGVAKESTPLQMVRIPSGADLSAYVNESSDAEISLTYLISTGAASSPGFSPWGELGTLTVKAYNPGGSEIFSDTLTSGDVANTFAEIIAGGAGTDGRYVTITLPSDATTGAYRITFNSSVAYNYVGLVSVSTGKHVWHVPRAGTTGRLSRGVWWFQGPTGSGTIHANYGNTGGLVAPSGRVYSHNGSNQTLNVTNEQGVWGLMPGIPAEVHALYIPYVRSSVSGAATSTKPLYAVNPSHYFDVAAVSVDTTAMPGPPHFIINNTDTGGGGDPLTITSSCPITPAVQNVVYGGFTFGASGGTPGYTWSIVSGALPMGLSLSGAGAVSGTPSEDGTFNFTVRVTDAVPDTEDLACSIVVSANNPPVITGAPLSAVTRGSAASGAYTATGDATIEFTVESGALPTGWALQTDGTITGTATTIGNFTANICATNSAGTSDPCHEQTYNVRPGESQGLTVSVVSSGPSAVVTVTRAGFDANTPMDLVVRTSDAVTEIFRSDTIPPGLASRRFALTIAPNTTYHVEVAGAGQDGYFIFSSPSTSGTGTFTWFSRHSTAANVLLEYGTTTSLGSSVSGSCTAGACSASIPSLTRGTVQYIRPTYRTSMDVVINPRGSIQPYLFK